MFPSMKKYWTLSVISGVVVALVTFTLGGLSCSVTNYPGRKAADQTAVEVASKDDWDHSETFRASRSCSLYASSSLASDLLRKRLRADEFRCYNSKIMESGAKTDAGARRVGTRVVAQIGCGVEGQTSARIMWTEDSKYCEIQAVTIYGALNFERVLER
jgi:hypothetical protein